MVAKRQPKHAALTQRYTNHQAPVHQPPEISQFVLSNIKL